MAPKRQAALAAQVNMAAVATEDTTADTRSPGWAPNVPKATKSSKNAKSAKSRTRAKVPDTKSSGNKITAAKPPTDHGVPLICVVCDGQPRFSDLSHLLTHLGSKGHLASINSKRVRSGSDMSAAQAVATYDKWYGQYHLEPMLAERLSIKDKKEKRKRSGETSTQDAKRKKTQSQQAMPVPPRPDPSKDAPSTPNVQSVNHQQPITFYGDFGHTTIATPTVSDPDWPEDDSEAVKLKGVVWPGMSIFDAATPEQKKKRNQRKDASVLLQMELDSQAITSMELVSNLDFEVERTRDVYDAPSVEGTPPPKKYRRRQRTRNDTDDPIDITLNAVKSEPDLPLEPTKRAPRVGLAHARELKVLQDAQEISASPEPYPDSVSERFEVTSDAEISVAADAGLNELKGIEAGVEYDNFPNGYPHADYFALPEELDPFNEASSRRPRFNDEFLDEARFDIRSRIPLQPMNPNASFGLASPTPVAKQPSHRPLRGKENNNHWQGQGFGNENSRSNGTGTNTVQNRMSTVGAVNSFHNSFQQPHDMTFANFQHSWPQPVRSVTCGFNPINSTPQSYFMSGPMFHLGTTSFMNDSDQGHGLGLFEEGS